VCAARGISQPDRCTSLLSVVLRVILFPPAPLFLSSSGLAGRSVWEWAGRSPCIVSSFRICSLGPVLGVLPSSWCRALGLGAQILRAIGFLIIALMLLWPEQVAMMGDAAPSNKSRAAGFLNLQIQVEVKLFLAGRGGEAERRSQR
jgi:hypothetical protein